MNDVVNYYRKDLARFPHSKAQRMGYMAVVWFNQPGDKVEARRLLIEAMLPFACSVVGQEIDRKRYKYADEADLLQAASLAVMQAVDSWDPAGGAALTTWCGWYIRRECLREDARHALIPGGEDVPLGHGDEDDEEGMVYFLDDTLSPGEVGAGSHDAEVLWNNLYHLPELERTAILELFFHERTMREVATNMKVSHTQVANLRDSALEHLRELYVYNSDWHKIE